LWQNLPFNHEIITILEELIRELIVGLEKGHFGLEKGRGFSFDKNISEIRLIIVN
jgi:hypothetical protein